ncbi:MAG TPA: T9SS type A sorting domain-containing protein [Firmicutes bacterium]|nr:T9SS type A sorting domain-containing protein [Bacillota bacterium]
MYYIGRNYPGPWSILSAVSEDNGFTFNKESGIRIPSDWGFENGVLSPFVYLDEGGEVTIVYSTYKEGTSYLRKFYTAKSYNGLNFYKKEEIVLTGETDQYDDLAASYGCIFRFNEKPRLFYTGQHNTPDGVREMRILSATETVSFLPSIQSLNQITKNKIRQNKSSISAYVTDLIGAATYYPVNIELTELQELRLLNNDSPETYSGEANVLCEANPEDGIERIELYINNLKKSEKQDYKLNYKWNTKEFENGDYLLTAIAYDKNNNYGVKTKVVKIYNQPGSSGGGDDNDDGDDSDDDVGDLPVAQIISPVNNSLFNQDIILIGNAYDNDNFKEYKVFIRNVTKGREFEVIKTCSESITGDMLAGIGISELLAGDFYEIKLMVDDLKGNIAEDSVVVKYLSEESDVEILELTGFNKPEDVAVDSNDNIYVADRNSNPNAGFDMIKIFDSDFNLISEIPAPEKPNSLFIEEVEDDIYVYVTEYQSNSMRKIKLPDTELLRIDTFLHPKGVWVTEEYIYIADTNGNKVRVFDREGILVMEIDVEKVEGICVDIEGNIYTTNGVKKQVNKLDKDGNLINEFGAFSDPADIYLDSFTRLWVIDRNEDIIKVFDIYGNELFELSGLNLNKPEGIYTDVDEEGNTNIYIADRNNNRILILKIKLEGEDETDIPDDSVIVVDSNTEKVINYPNPCKNCDEVKIRFNVPESGLVELGIYNLNGAEIYSISKSFSKGRQEFSWKLINKAKKKVSSGIYLYVIKVNGKEIRKGKIVIVK